MEIPGVSDGVAKLAGGGNFPRIVISIRHFCPDGGGAEVVAKRLACGLAERGVDATVWTGRYGRSPCIETVGNVRVERHFVGLYLPVLHEICYLISFALKLVSRKHTYDVVHVVQTQASAFIAVLVAKLLGKGVITTSHGAGEGGDMASWSLIPAGSKLLKRVCNGVDATTGVSRRVVAELHDFGFDPSRTWYIPNGAPLPSPVALDRAAARVQLGLPQNAFVGVFVGRLSNEKAPHLALKAWAEIRKKKDDSRLVLVGDGPERPFLEELVRRDQLQEHVIFAGRVDDVEAYLGAGDVFVLPSRTEGMSLALLEAMAAGLPVVASKVSGTVDLVVHGKNGLLFDSGDAAGLTSCLMLLLESELLRAEFGAEAAETVKMHYSLERMVGRYMAVYRLVWSRVSAGATQTHVERS